MHTYINQSPIIAILRGANPETIVDIAHLLYQRGVRVIEVPLNRPNAFECIARLVKHLPHDCLVGAGTVTAISQVDRLVEIGAKVIISPHCDQALIRYGLDKKLFVVPGISTATEAFQAYHSGARWLKLFPAMTTGIEHLKALRSVLPEDTHFIAVGGVSGSNYQQWLAAGVSAVGIGNALFSQDDTLTEVAAKLDLFFPL